MFDAKLARFSSKPGRLGRYLVEESLGFLIRKVDTQGGLEFAKQRFDLLARRLWPSQDAVDSMHFVTQGFMLLHDCFDSFGLCFHAGHDGAPKGMDDWIVQSMNCAYFPGPPASGQTVCRSGTLWRLAHFRRRSTSSSRSINCEFR
jgi:hypothetical protein